MSSEVVGGEGGVGGIEHHVQRPCTGKSLAHLGTERRPKRLELIKEEG